MEEIKLNKLLKFYAKNWIIILLVTAIGVLSGLIYNSFIQKPLYQSDATLLLVNPIDKATILDATAINNYVELFKSRRVLEPVIKSQSLNTTYDSLVKSVSATNPKDTQVITIAISTKDPNVSKNFINNAIASFKQQVATLYGFDSVQVVDSASFNTTPSNVNKGLQLMLAALAGFVLAIIIMFFAYDSKSGQKYINNITATIKRNVTFKKKRSVKKTTKSPKKQTVIDKKNVKKKTKK